MTITPNSIAHARGVPATEMITEIYVQRPHSPRSCRASAMLRQRRANVIYGTVRMIERDDERFLAWAGDRTPA